jgi:hypothetical protein
MEVYDGKSSVAKPAAVVSGTPFAETVRSTMLKRS